MIDKLKKLEYFVLIKYYFMGIIISVFTFKVTKNILIQDAYLFDKELLILEFATLIGALVGGIFFIFILNYDKQKELDDKQIKTYVSRGYSHILYKNIIVFSLALFVGLLTRNAFEISNFNELFSTPNSNNYISIIVAGSIFGLIMSIGKIKRYKLLISNR